MFDYRRDRLGRWRPLLCCAWCESPCGNPTGWLVLFGTDIEPAAACGQECAASIRDDNPRQVWLEQPISQLVASLALTYGSPRRSWRCGVCRSRERADIDRALLDGVPQREVAQQYGFAKTAIFNHSRGHLPVTAMIAAGR
jgi:hypothetical protein